MNKYFLSFAFLLFASVNCFAQTAVPAGCVASPNFSAEAYNVWLAEGVKTLAGVNSTEPPLVPVSQRIDLELHPNETEFSGFVHFTIPVSGTYVIATDAYPRMDVTDATTGEILDPVDFGKIKDCGTVSKALRFEFSEPRDIHLGFISRKGAFLNFLIWRMN